jgi:hypothetical protein
MKIHIVHHLKAARLELTRRNRLRRSRRRCRTIDVQTQRKYLTLLRVTSNDMSGGPQADMPNQSCRVSRRWRGSIGFVTTRSNPAARIGRNSSPWP